MNPIQSKLKQERKICKNEIIQIGAVCLNEEYDEIEVEIFQWSKNDYDQIRKEMTLKQYEPSGKEAEFMKEEWMDLQV